MKWCANLLSLMLLVLAAQLNAEQESRNVIVSSGTLILIGASASDITIAADSATSSPPEGIRTGATKIYPIGKFTVCTLNNTAALREVVGVKVVDIANFHELVQQWAMRNRGSSVRQANTALSQVIGAELKRFYVKHFKDFKELPPKRITVSLVCMGYDLGSPIALSNDFHESPQNDQFEPDVNRGDFILPAGRFVPLGESQVCIDLIRGTSSVLEKYRRLEAVQKYRKLEAAGKLDELSTDDLIRLSETCLRATESPAGRKFDSGAVGVAAPNHYVVISNESGFHVRKPPN